MIKQQNSNKKKKKLRAAARPKSSRRGRAGGASVVKDGFNASSSQLPAAISTTYSRYFDVKEVVSRTGHKVTKMVGRCLVAYAYAYYPAGVPTPSLPLLNATGSGTPTQCIYLSPTTIFANTGCEEYAMASGFNKYRFTACQFVYTGRSSSSLGGAIWLAYYPDGAISSGDFSSPGGVGFLPGAFNSSVWAGNVSSDVSKYLDRDQWYYVDQDTDTDAGYRQSFQGALVAYWDTIVSTAGGYGQVWMTYELELCDPAGVFNFAGPLPPKPRTKKLSVNERIQERKMLSQDASKPLVVAEEPASLQVEPVMVPSQAYPPVSIGADGPSRPPSRRDGRRSPPSAPRIESKERGMLGLW